jgi:imidazolonepropionase-like amidohydrolase
MRIRAVGASVERPQGARVIDLGDVTLLPGLIDAHVHLFLHPGSESLQTVQESIPYRTILAVEAAKADLLAGFTAERDMGTEGAGSADTAVRDAIDQGLIPGRGCASAAMPSTFWAATRTPSTYNPAQHILSNADYANSIEQLIEVIREQHKEGSDFAKIYETGPDKMIDGVAHTPYQYTEAQLSCAVERRRLGVQVAVHATGEPGTLYAALAGVASIDHATPTERRDHAPDAREADSGGAHLRHLRVLCPQRHLAGGRSAKKPCSITRFASSKSRLPRGYRLRWAPTWAPFRTARRPWRWS